ncbi:hypothetical protein AFE_1009 [Acidithiobacillus ferrooxidans ATCC 23270]|uniref:Uncharacterized protein n=1 Tax=Acidithiobacillus ferrooxidans (strain ATCC 23270 / DSM 14882 / CIP 104768 / NCIMB 8455) TaxID=243159 RepID=B7J7I4_ACIF2|nr:hypothetical protein AFE_1009 [Acidithiobacillus ferrooxidans ATCC 23270]
MAGKSALAEHKRARRQKAWRLGKNRLQRSRKIVYFIFISPNLSGGHLCRSVY